MLGDLLSGVGGGVASFQEGDDLFDVGFDGAGEFLGGLGSLFQFFGMFRVVADYGVIAADGGPAAFLYMFQGVAPFVDVVGAGSDDGQGGAGGGEVAFGVVGGFVLEALGPVVVVSFGRAGQGFGAQDGPVAEPG